jgi:hypothetical protein
LLEFLINWNDSWVIIETDKFIDFIESKGYSGFLTNEEGITSVALKNIDGVEIINFYEN